VRLTDTSTYMRGEVCVSLMSMREPVFNPIDRAISYIISILQTRYMTYY
jgi:hypothetical protein